MALRQLCQSLNRLNVHQQTSSVNCLVSCWRTNKWIPDVSRLPTRKIATATSSLQIPFNSTLAKRPLLDNSDLAPFLDQIRHASISNMLYKGKVKKRPKKLPPLGPGVPMAKGVVLKTVVRNPRKPNSANRKCVLVRLPDGREMFAYIPGEGHTLQEHSVVLVINKNLKDTPGVKLRCVRGKYDLEHVFKKTKKSK